MSPVAHRCLELALPIAQLHILLGDPGLYGGVPQGVGGEGTEPRVWLKDHSSPPCENSL
jgi:hypothetical protein